MPRVRLHQVDAIAQNVRYFADTPAGRLEITINLSKPEKDPKEIAKLKNAPSVGYPKCMLCVENPGYRGRSNFPARQNHRMVPLRSLGRRGICSIRRMRITRSTASC